jgi:hypothetical protein
LLSLDFGCDWSGDGKDLGLTKGSSCTKEDEGENAGFDVDDGVAFGVAVAVANGADAAGNGGNANPCWDGVLSSDVVLVEVSAGVDGFWAMAVQSHVVVSNARGSKDASYLIAFQVLEKLVMLLRLVKPR